MTTEKSSEEMAVWAAATRARAEGSIVRGYFLNKVVPAIEREMIRRIGAGEAPTIVLPEVEEFAQAFMKRIGEANNIPELT